MLAYISPSDFCLVATGCIAKHAHEDGLPLDGKIDPPEQIEVCFQYYGRTVLKPFEQADVTSRHKLIALQLFFEKDAEHLAIIGPHDCLKAKPRYQSADDIRTKKLVIVIGGKNNFIAAEQIGK